MSGLQIAIGMTGEVVLAILFAGLLWRGHYRREPLFVAYVGGVMSTNLALGIWYGRQMWLLHQTISAALRFGVALGLCSTVFGNFPAAAVTARRVALLVLVITLVGLMAMPDGEDAYTDIVGVAVPRIANGTVWLFTGLAALVLWYRLPLTMLQKAILLGFAPYLLVFTVTMNLLASVGWRVRDLVGYADTLAFMTLVGYWSWTAWRSEASDPALPGPTDRPAVMASNAPS